MQAPPDDGPGTVESPPEDDPNAFDPGVETGYLRRAPREGPPDVELGAHPFDPGEDVGFDDRRAKRRRKQREREERELAEAEAAVELEREREQADGKEAKRREAVRLAREEAEEAQRHETELARLEAAERELEEAEQRAVAEAERARRESGRQDRAEREARARARKKKAAAPPPMPPSTPASTKTSPRRPTRPMPPPDARARIREPPSLRRATAKLGAAALAIAAGALLLGAAAGLPTPFSDSEGGVATLNAQGVAVGSGIAASLYRGPFHPVRGDYDYGEKDAEFGADRGGRRHEGQDIFSKRGTPVVAVRDGIVVDRAKENSTHSGGRGNYVAIYSPIENRSFVYLHLLEPPPVEKDDRVHAGQLVGLMGCTGSCYGTHLHFEVRRGRASFAADTKAVNPRPYLDDLQQAPEELAEP